MLESKPRKTLPFLLLGFGLLLIVVAIYYIAQDIPPQTDLSAVPVPVNYAAPEISLTDTQGVLHALADYRGKVVLVNLWATWCPPCKAEMPLLQDYFNKHNNQGFTIIAINDGDPTADVLQFLKEYQLTFAVWLDPTYQATDHAFKTLNLPSSYVIDRNGMIRLMWVGEINRKTLDKTVTPIIMENQ